MPYYRLAVQKRQTAQWAWKSTVVTSLEAVLHLLRIYSPIPAERIRVFSAACEEEMTEMLNRENNGLLSGSVTAGQFLGVRGLRVQEGSAQATLEKTVRRSIATALDSPMRENRSASHLADMSSIGLLDQSRLQIELGTGSDHDTLYQFSLPTSTPQLLAWIRLMVRVQAGEM